MAKKKSNKKRGGASSGPEKNTVSEGGSKSQPIEEKPVPAVETHANPSSAQKEQQPVANNRNLPTSHSMRGRENKQNHFKDKRKQRSSSSRQDVPDNSHLDEGKVSSAVEKKLGGRGIKDQKDHALRDSIPPSVPVSQETKQYLSDSDRTVTIAVAGTTDPVLDPDNGKTILSNELCDADMVDFKCWISCLQRLIHPSHRKLLGVDVSTLSEQFLVVAKYAGVMVTEDTLKNLTQSGTSSVEVDALLETLGEITPTIFVAWCASRGYLADDFVNTSRKEITDNMSLNLEGELCMLLSLVDALREVVSDEKYREEFSALDLIARSKSAVDSKDEDYLTKANIVYQLSDPEDRFRLGLEVSDDEVAELVSKSLAEDRSLFGLFVDSCPDRLFTVRNVGSILRVVEEFTGSGPMDIRHAEAVDKILPRALEALSSADRDILARQFANNKDTRVKEWLGHLEINRKCRNRRTGSSDFITDAMLSASTVDELMPTILTCALIAPYESTPTGTGLCKKIAQLLMGQPHATPLPKRKLLLETLLCLPPFIRDILMNEERKHRDQSLLSTAEMLMSSARDKNGACALKLLCDAVSPSRLLSEVILPRFAEKEHRGNAAAALVVLLTVDELKTELCSSEPIVSLCDLVKLALNNYEEPDLSAATVLARYVFMEKIFIFADDVLTHAQETPFLEQMLKDVKNSFETRGLEWYQLAGIMYSFFEGSLQKLDLIKLPSFEPDFASLKALNITRVLQTWPGDKVRKAFTAITSEYLADCDDILMSCVFLEELAEAKTRLKTHASFVHSLILEKCGATVDGDCDEKSEKSDKMEEGVVISGTEVEQSPTPTVEATTSDEPVDMKVADEDSQVNDVMQETEPESELDTSWMSVLDGKMCPADVRSAVLAAACRYSCYRATALRMISSGQNKIEVDAESSDEVGFSDTIGAINPSPTQATVGASSIRNCSDGLYFSKRLEDGKWVVGMSVPSAQVSTGARVRNDFIGFFLGSQGMNAQALQKATGCRFLFCGARTHGVRWWKELPFPNEPLHLRVSCPERENDVDRVLEMGVAAVNSVIEEYTGVTSTSCRPTCEIDESVTVLTGGESDSPSEVKTEPKSYEVPSLTECDKCDSTSNLDATSETDEKKGVTEASNEGFTESDVVVEETFADVCK